MKKVIFSIAVLLIVYIFIGFYFYGLDARAVLWPLFLIFLMGGGLSY